MLAATEALDLGRVLLDLLIIVVVAKLAAELAERVRIPAVLGEIVAGILIGPSVLGLIDPAIHDTGSMLALLGEIGVLLLLLQVGLEMDLTELGKVGKASMLVAVVGVVIPFAGGALGAWGMGEAGKTAIFLGGALTATSVGITARVLGDLRALSRTESRVVLGAAVADDVIGLIVLTVVVKVVTDGSVSAGTVASTIGWAMGFLLLTGVAGILLAPRVLGFVARFTTGNAALVATGLALMLGFAVLADAAKLAFIIGAFMAGLAIGRSREGHRIAEELTPVGNVFIPIFFVGIGINADIGAMTDPSVLGLAAVLTVIGVAGKVVAGWAAVGTTTDRLLIGIGMIPRGEVGLIFASIGLSQGVLDQDLYGALLVMVLATTLIAPPLLRWRIQRVPVPTAAVTAEPPGGWLVVEDGAVVLCGVPPAELLVPLGLDAARLAASGAKPTESLLQWFASHSDEAVTWARTDTDELLALLATGDVRSWRLLEVTGVLERALPEVHDAMVRHRADPTELDLLRSLRFPTVERVQMLLAAPGSTAAMPSDADLPSGDDDASILLVAAMAHDVDAGADALIQRLQVGSPGSRAEASAVLACARHLHAESTRRIGVDDDTVDALVDMIGDPHTARLAATLAQAIADDDTVHHAVLDELTARIEQRLSAG